MINHQFTFFKTYLFSFLLFYSSILFANEAADIQPLAKHSLLLDVDIKQGLAVAVGQRGHVLYSNNHNDWHQANVPVRHLLTAVYLQDAQTGFAVGHHGVILKTTDGAKNWRQVFISDDESPLLDIHFVDESTGFAIGAYGAWYITQDAGESWQKSDINSSSEFDLHLNAITPAEKDSLYIVGEAGVILRSDNLGKDWQTLPSPYHGSLFGVLSLSSDELIVFGLKGRLFHTKDAGNTWHKVETAVNTLLTDAIQLGSNTVIVTGMAGTLLISRDNGETYNAHTLVESADISALTENNQQLILVGEKGTHRLDLNQLDTLD